MIRALLLAASLLRHGSGAPDRAEFAVRWDPAEGGPANAAEVFALLDLPARDGAEYEVRYFDLGPPEGAPAGAAVILRQRTGKDGAGDVRLKYRLARPLEGKWSCPAGARFEKDSEIDVSFGAAPEPARVYAYSCTLEAPAPPAFLSAVPKGCSSRVTRHASGRWKVEDWSLPGGGRRLELSLRASDTPAQAAEFSAIVGQLRGRGAKPQDASKTDLGSRCPDGGGRP
jgi:hypothetical protein